MSFLVNIAIIFVIGLIVALITGNSIIGWAVGILLFLFGLVGSFIDLIFGCGGDDG